MEGNAAAVAKVNIFNFVGMKLPYKIRSGSSEGGRSTAPYVCFLADGLLYMCDMHLCFCFDTTL